MDIWKIDSPLNKAGAAREWAGGGVITTAPAASCRDSMFLLDLLAPLRNERKPAVQVQHALVR
jgi:hypothetical protein